MSKGPREEWVQLWNKLDAEATNSKDSLYVIDRLSIKYRSLGKEDAAVVDELLAERLLTGDEKQRFDALALVREYRIATAIPALRRLLTHLEYDPRPGAVYEWAKVNGILGDLMAREGA